MVLADFYTIRSSQVREDGKHLIEIGIHPEHPIFDGHFPGRPVTPGVCMLQIIKNITEDLLQTKLRMRSAKNIRFYAIIDPSVHPILRLELTVQETESIQIKANCSFEETLALKMDLNFCRIYPVV
jgi:3-hydroxyacyl-[acyl-carrier-protein] dehydratase